MANTCPDLIKDSQDKYKHILDTVLLALFSVRLYYNYNSLSLDEVLHQLKMEGYYLFLLVIKNKDKIQRKQREKAIFPGICFIKDF